MDPGQLAHLVLEVVVFVAERAVDHGQLAQLGAFPLVVLVLLGLQQLFQNLCRCVHGVLIVRRDVDVQVLVVGRVVDVGNLAAGLHGALAAHHDLGPGLPLHLLLRVATRPQNETDERVARILLDGDKELLFDLFGRCLDAAEERVVGLQLGHLFLQRLPLLCQTLTQPHVTCVDTFAHAVVGRRRRGRASSFHLHPFLLLRVVALRHLRRLQVGLRQKLGDFEKARLDLLHLRVLARRQLILHCLLRH